MQCYLGAEGLDEYAASKAHKYVKSTGNQRIGSYWSHFRRQRSSWWIDFFNDFHESDILDLTDEIHTEALFALWISCRMILIKERIIGIRTASESQGMLLCLECQI